ncbi:MAG: hypothetical protein PHS54_00600 [Clostridia bacterium]|nr:hypothetical protein [Clostridia bacterium]
MKNFLQPFLKLFYNRLKYRGFYAIHSGDTAGGFFTYIKEEDRGDSYALLLMPDPMKAIYVKKSDIELDQKYDNIMFVKKIPKDVYEVCKANFIYYAKVAGIYANR